MPELLRASQGGSAAIAEVDAKLQRVSYPLQSSHIVEQRPATSEATRAEWVRVSWSGERQH
jgi:hypothetical protein